MHDGKKNSNKKYGVKICEDFLNFQPESYQICYPFSMDRQVHSSKDNQFNSFVDAGTELYAQGL